MTKREREFWGDEWRGEKHTISSWLVEILKNTAIKNRT